MKLSELIAQLGQIYLEEGDLDAFIDKDDACAHLQSVEVTWITDIKVKNKKPILLLSEWIEPR